MININSSDDQFFLIILRLFINSSLSNIYVSNFSFQFSIIVSIFGIYVFVSISSSNGLYYYIII